MGSIDDPVLQLPCIRISELHKRHNIHASIRLHDHIFAWHARRAPTDSRKTYGPHLQHHISILASLSNAVFPHTDSITYTGDCNCTHHQV